MKYFIKQNAEKDCGITCVKILAAMYHHDDSYLFDLQNKSASSMYELKEELLKRNIESNGYYIDDLNKIKKYKKSIILIKEDSINHYVILIKLSKKYAYILDPKLGERIISLDYFINIFTKYILIIEKVNKKKRKKPSYFMYKIAYFSSFLIDFSLIYFLTYIVNIKGQFLYNLLLIASLVLNFSFKLFISFSFGNNFEKNQIMPLFTDKINVIDLNVAQEYKALLIEYTFKKIAYHCIIVFIILLLIKNSFINIFSLCYIVIHFLFVRKIEDNKKIIESNLYYYLKNDLKIDKYQYLNIKKKSSIYVALLASEKIFFWFVLLFFSIIINYINSLSSFIFISINFFMSLTLSNLLENLYEIENNKKERMNEIKIKFLKIERKLNLIKE